MKTLIAIAILAAAPAASAAAVPRARPVMVGGGGGGVNVDPCPAFGEVRGLNPRGDNFLSVRAAPNLGAREVGRLKSGEEVLVCDGSSDKKWWGVVYGRQGQDCRLVAAKPPRPYAGPCRSGWVSGRYLRVIG
jgi:hypothetical protein